MNHSGQNTNKPESPHAPLAGAAGVAAAVMLRNKDS